jgi:hypothetical protein
MRHTTSTKTTRRVEGRDRLSWRQDGDCFALYRDRAARPMLRVVPDATYPGIWRVRWPDGRLSDMVNLTRAKDAAVSLALRLLNRERGEETAQAARVARQIEEALPEVLPIHPAAHQPLN